jgi:hypothetical protein
MDHGELVMQKYLPHGVVVVVPHISKRFSLSGDNDCMHAARSMLQTSCGRTELNSLASCDYCFLNQLWPLVVYASKLFL